MLEMPGFLFGGLTVSICVEPSRKMFQLCIRRFYLEKCSSNCIKSVFRKETTLDTEAHGKVTYNPVR